MLRQLLEQTGFTVLEAANGREALDMLARHQPHLILMDLRMPVMDGYEAVKNMRSAEYGVRNKDGKPDHLPIMALTAHVMPDGGPSVLTVGFDDVIYKPFDAAELLDKIGRQLGVHYAPEPSCASVGGGPGRDAAAVTPADLVALPAGWVEEFSKALRRGRSAELLRLIDQVRPAHADLAEALAGLVRIHEYDTLMAVTEETRKEAPHG